MARVTRSAAFILGLVAFAALATTAMARITPSNTQQSRRLQATGTFDTSGYTIEIVKATPGDAMDGSWVQDGSWCYGIVMYNVTNMGDRIINPNVPGPVVVTAPAGSNVLLAAPNAWSYSTNDTVNASFATGVTITDFGTYAMKDATSTFAFIVMCDNGSPYPNNTYTCNCTGLPDTFTAIGDVTGGSTNANCNAPFTLADDGVCVEITRQNPANGDSFDNSWSDGQGHCFGQTLYTITNGGLGPIGNMTGSVAVTLTGTKLVQPNEYNYFSSDAAANATSFTIQSAGWWMAENGGNSTFALTTYCDSDCPCTGWSATFNIQPYTPTAA